MIPKRCLALVVCTVVLSIGCTKKEKVTYQGKPLSTWIEMLNDKDPIRRFPAIKAVGEIGPEAREAIPLLIKTIRESRNRDRRTLVACNHALLGMDKEIVPHMISLLKDDEWEMRRGAAWILGKLGPEAKEAVPALTEALNDSNAAVRTKAEESLKKIRGEEGASMKPDSGESALPE
jgi:HEAT repeat protein